IKLSKKGLNPTNKRNPSTGISRYDGVVHHALAFNTLLSSQETDAFFLVWILSNRNSEAPFSLLTSLYQAAYFSVKPGGLKKIGRPS
ncbi:hypothetical protein, partial [Nonomuraea sp. B5E05]|uniref:hypothetical protein n=1 Tax=Nonomuraea sp. B5E05 TaxID=3153569 RepID=UPI00326093F9